MKQIGVQIKPKNLIMFRVEYADPTKPVDNKETHVDRLYGLNSRISLLKSFFDS